MARILVVDDEEPARLTIRKIFEKAGHEVIESVNGVGAIAESQSQPFDLVISDNIMLKKDGVDGKLRERSFWNGPNWPEQCKFCSSHLAMKDCLKEFVVLS